jgi:hypothetical protein
LELKPPQPESIAEISSFVFMQSVFEVTGPLLIGLDQPGKAVDEKLVPRMPPVVDVAGDYNTSP